MLQPQELISNKITKDKTECKRGLSESDRNALYKIGLNKFCDQSLLYDQLYNV